jgi:hypothetical protein
VEGRPRPFAPRHETAQSVAELMKAIKGSSSGWAQDSSTPAIKGASSHWVTSAWIARITLDGKKATPSSPSALPNRTVHRNPRGPPQITDARGGVRNSPSYS